MLQKIPLMNILVVHVNGAMHLKCLSRGKLQAIHINLVLGCGMKISVNLEKIEEEVSVFPIFSSVILLTLFRFDKILSQKSVKRSFVLSCLIFCSAHTVKLNMDMLYNFHLYTITIYKYPQKFYFETSSKKAFIIRFLY